MSRYKDNSGIKETCPWIDEAIDVLEKSQCEYNYSEAKSAIASLEKVRSANSDLRDWGNSLYREVEELKDEIKCLEKRIEDMESL